MSQIHPTAIIGNNVTLGNNVSVGPYTVIEEGVRIGDNTSIANSCTITGQTTIGNNNRIYSHAVIGSHPQDKKFKPGEKVFLEIGDNNTFREFVTFNTGTESGGGTTRVGSNNLFMAYVHVAHDCVVGNNTIFANVGTLGGHVEVADHAVIGGLAAAHQFVRIGTLAMIGGCSKVAQDVPPYAMCDGARAKIFGINTLGLKRANMSLSTVKAIKQTYKILFHSELKVSSAIEKVKKEVELLPEVDTLLKFVSDSKRGVVGAN